MKYVVNALRIDVFQNQLKISLEMFCFGKGTLRNIKAGDTLGELLFS